MERMKDSVPCPYLEHEKFTEAELYCAIQECGSCPMKYRYFQEEFKARTRRK
jgi:hypothetical protein